MRILWVKTDFLHPTNRGGQIRTLEMLRELHKRHEIHYVAFDDPSNPEGLVRSREYCSHAYPVEHQTVSKSSPLFAIELIRGIYDSLPVAGARYRSPKMRQVIEEVTSKINFDAKICDFLFPSVNIPDLGTWTIFQHNVESVIWDRHAESGRTPAHKAYFSLQAKRMFRWERDACRSAQGVVAVSKVDAQLMQSRFGLASVPWVPTGVDTRYFERQPVSEIKPFDLVFVGSMDWMPNIDGIRWFVAESLPLLRAQRAETSVAIVGRNPPKSILDLAAQHNLTVTGAVPDVRPYLWGAKASIVPLRIGGGTRLKIFEAMAAGVPVISTAIGAEGLPATHNSDILIADEPAAFSSECLRLLLDQDLQQKLRQRALDMVNRDYSWEQVTNRFEAALQLPVGATL